MHTLPGPVPIPINLMCLCGCTIGKVTIAARLTRDGANLNPDNVNVVTYNHVNCAMCGRDLLNPKNRKDATNGNEESRIRS